MTSVVSVLFVLFSGVHLSLESSGKHSWSYDNGAAEWPGVCQTGKRQSPINIVSDDAVKTDLGPLKFVRYDFAYTGSLTNNGHTVEIALTGVPLILKGGGLSSNYVFQQMHFHWGSEHTIDGHRDLLELHMVHYAIQYENLTVASQYDNGLAVVAVLFKLGDEDNSDLTSILKATKEATKMKTIPIQGKIVPAFLLPKDYTTYWRYEGSLTTPDCHETVTWFVLNEKLTISDRQLRVFQNVTTSNDSLKFNYRPAQELGSRDVYLRLPGYSGAASILPKINMMFVSMLATIVFSIFFHPSN